MSTTTKTDGINAAMGIAEDIAAGTVDPTDLDAAVAAECETLFGTVIGPEDAALFPLQVDVARQVLAAGGISATEVAEWAAVLKRRAGAVEPTDDAVTPDGPDVPADLESSANGTHSPDSSDGDAEPEVSTEV